VIWFIHLTDIYVNKFKIEQININSFPPNLTHVVLSTPLILSPYWDLVEELNLPRDQTQFHVYCLLSE
jgi:hypothetical protein